MKKILVLSLIFVFSLALGGCTKKATQPAGSLDSSDYEKGDTTMEKDNTKTNKDDSMKEEDNKMTEDDDSMKEEDDDTTMKEDVDPGVTQADLDKLKSNINAMEYEDLSGLSQD